MLGVAIIGVIGTITVALLGSLDKRAQLEIPLRATEIAEARSLQLTLTALALSPTNTPVAFQ
jgi:hypothetical protein